jgi:hypothetical protein
MVVPTVLPVGRMRVVVGDVDLSRDEHVVADLDAAHAVEDAPPIQLRA